MTGENGFYELSLPEGDHDLCAADNYHSCVHLTVPAGVLRVDYGENSLSFFCDDAPCALQLKK